MTAGAGVASEAAVKNALFETNLLVPETRITSVDLPLRYRREPGMTGGGAAADLPDVHQSLGLAGLLTRSDTATRSRSWSYATNSLYSNHAPHNSG
jgi:hypothetical protein